MTLVCVNYRNSGRCRPHFLNNAAIEATARAVRAQLVSDDAEELPLSVLSAISELKVNDVGYDLWCSLDHPVTDYETGEVVCGLCEFDPDSGDDAVSLLVSPVGEFMTEELVLSTFGHELGHAVFEAPGWIADAKAGPDLFDVLPGSTRKAFRTTTHDGEHLGNGNAMRNAGLSKEMRIAEFRANEFMGSLLVPRTHLTKALEEMASIFDVKLQRSPSLDPEIPSASLQVADESLSGFTNLSMLQNALAGRFGVHRRFIEVRMERYGLLKLETKPR